jgi:hypothetical protein
MRYYLGKIVAVIILFGLIFLDQQSLAQHANKNDVSSSQINNVVQQIEASINSGGIANLSSAMATEISLNIRGTESGMFSANQALVILQNYFSSRKIVQFNFSKKQINLEPFYATGGGVYSYKGRREHFQVYIGFLIRDGRPFLAQFNVY